MNAVGERSVPLWMTVDVPNAPALEADVTADVAVVGAGIAGLSTAYELARAGLSVVVLDRGALAGGMSSRTSAHLTSTIDDLYQELIRMRGVPEARAYLRSRLAAIDRIEEIQAEERIDCDFKRVDGYLFPAKSADVETLEKERDAARQIGFVGVKFVTDTPIPDAGVGRALRYPRQARFHPRKYLAGLIRCIARDGGRLFGDTPVTAVEEHEGGVRITTTRGPAVEAKVALIATNSPINDWIAIHTKQAPYRTYVIAGRVARGSVPDALYWDTLDPYHYVRLQPGDGKHDWLIVGGEDHKTGEADDGRHRLDKLEAWSRSLVPGLGRVEYSWSGQVLDPVDYLPYSGLNPGSRSVYVHTGDSGEGLNNALVGALVLRDLMRGRKHRWAKMLDPSRVTPRAAGRYVSENVSVAANLAGYVGRGDVASADEVKSGEGAILNEGGKKVAVYRDRRGKLHRRSAACTHAGCLLHWNSFENCWDCTCHGSQFSPLGEPLNAPAFTPLAEIGTAAEAKAAKRSAPGP